MSFSEQVEQVTWSASDTLRPWLSASLLWLLLAGSDGAAQAPDPGHNGREELLRQKLALLERVLERSGSSSDGAAARSALEAARAALAAGDQKAAESHLMEAFPLAGRAAREQAAQMRDGQARQRYEERVASVTSLSEAYDAILSTSGPDSEPAVTARVSLLMDQGRKYAERDDFVRAAKRADEAQEILVDAIRRLRDHQTVVSRLEFASPAEEYDYETRRFRTYELLLQLATQSPQSEAAKQQIAKAQGAGVLHHQEAAGAAEKGDWAGALESEQGAISALILALRYAGVFLPQ